MQNHAVSWTFSPSNSNGKKKDYESGFHYYGARYHWSEVLNGWLSVDPMADKYPGISPYNYCMWNPVKLIDPDGMTWKDIDGNVITDHSNIRYIYFMILNHSKYKVFKCTMMQLKSTGWVVLH